MPNRCTFCEVVRIPTNHLILGTTWYEFCENCGEKQMFARMNNGALESKSIKELLDDAAEDRINKERLNSE